METAMAWWSIPATLASGTAGREAAVDMVENIPGSHRITIRYGVQLC